MNRNTHLKKISFLVIKLKQIFNIKINVNIFFNKVTQKNYNLIIQMYPNIIIPLKTQ